MGIADIKAQLFATKHFFCGGHGARWPSHGMFTIPVGITLKFYCRDGDPLDNDVGKQVDQIVNGGAPPGGSRTRTAGQQVWDYRLFNSRSGVYLNLGMSGKANPNYITTGDNANGLPLSAICRVVIATCPTATIHWSACRVVEPEGAHYDLAEAEYQGALKVLSEKRSR